VILSTKTAQLIFKMFIYSRLHRYNGHYFVTKIYLSTAVIRKFRTTEFSTSSIALKYILGPVFMIAQQSL